MGPYIFSYALTFAVALGSSLNPGPPGRGLKLLPRDIANVNALLQICLIVILAFLNNSIENLIIENNIKNVKTRLKLIEIY